MKLTYLGTAAAEGIPALFCRCDTCRQSRVLGGRNLRTRSQALIGETLLIDFPADSLGHMFKSGADFSLVEALIITHTHGDHFYPIDFANRRQGFAHLDGCPPLTIAGSPDIVPAVTDICDKFMQAEGPNHIDLRVLLPEETTILAGYEVTPLRAVHGTDNPYIYVVSDGTKTLMYAHDTGPLPDSTWHFLTQRFPRFDFVSMDCTIGFEDMTYAQHMNFKRCIAMRRRMLDCGIAGNETQFCVNHFSHNGHATYEEMIAPAAREGLLVSYDGMICTI